MIPFLPDESVVCDSSSHISPCPSHSPPSGSGCCLPSLPRRLALVLLRSLGPHIVEAAATSLDRGGDGVNAGDEGSGGSGGSGSGGSSSGTQGAGAASCLDRDDAGGSRGGDGELPEAASTGLDPEGHCNGGERAGSQGEGGCEGQGPPSSSSPSSSSI